MTVVFRYPSLRVAYVEEREEIVSDVPKKVYYSILVKAVNGFDQVSKAFLQYLIICASLSCKIFGMVTFVLII